MLKHKHKNTNKSIKNNKSAPEPRYNTTGCLGYENTPKAQENNLKTNP